MRLIHKDPSLQSLVHKDKPSVMREMPKIPEVPTFQALLDEIDKAFEGDEVDVDYVVAVMNAYKSNPKEWKAFRKFDNRRYSRNLVHGGNGKYNIMTLCWGEGQQSSIHDHPTSHCFLKVIEGNMRETQYEWPKEGQEEMVVKCVNDAKVNDTCYINDDIALHRVENVSHVDPSVSLHVYIPPYQECTIFDDKTSKKGQAKVTFYSRFGKRTPFRPGDVNQCGMTKTTAGIDAEELPEGGLVGNLISQFNKYII